MGPLAKSFLLEMEHKLKVSVAIKLCQMIVDEKCYSGSNAVLTSEKILNHLTTARPFIFPPIGNTNLKEYKNQDYPSLPFKVCTFETPGSNFLFHMGTIGVALMIAVELFPGKLDVFTLGVDKDPKLERPAWSFGQFEDHADPHFYGTINFFLDQLPSSQVGQEKIMRHFRIKNGPLAGKHTIRDVIHIRPKPKIIKSEKERISPSRIINWSHQWEVMGHWRKIQGLGKDRDGKYEVSGLTWVLPHIKGNENEPLIIKKRVLSQSL